MLTDRQMDKKQTNEQTELHLATMVIYLPVKFEFVWTKRFQVRVQKRKFWRTDKRTNEQTELHQFRQESSCDGDLFPC